MWAVAEGVGGGFALIVLCVGVGNCSCGWVGVRLDWYCSGVGVISMAVGGSARTAVTLGECGGACSGSDGCGIDVAVGLVLLAVRCDLSWLVLAGLDVGTCAGFWWVEL